MSKHNCQIVRFYCQIKDEKQNLCIESDVKKAKIEKKLKNCKILQFQPFKF